MSRVPYFNFYPADFMGGVRGLTAQEVGVYTMLLCRIYEECGPVEYHVLRLSTYCGMREATFTKTVEKLVELGKLTLADGMISNGRAEAEIAKRADGLKFASRAGKVSAEKRQQNQQKSATPVQRPFNHTDTDTDKYSVAKATDENADPVKEIFDAGVRVLRACSVPERQARTFIGKLRKDHPGRDGEILTAIMDCGRAGAVDPIPWITTAMKPKEPTRYFDLSNFGMTQ